MSKQQVTESAITEIIADVAKRIGDAKFISGEVDRLSGSQPNIIQYVVAHKQDLELEEIIHLLFQVAVLQKIVGQATGRVPAVVGYAELDAAATATPTLEALAEREPDLAAYIFSNLELQSDKANKIAGEILAHVSQAMLHMVIP